MPVDFGDDDYSDSHVPLMAKRSATTNKGKRKAQVIDLTDEDDDESLLPRASTSNARPSPRRTRRQSSSDDIVFTGQSNISPATTRTLTRQPSTRSSDHSLQFPARPSFHFVDLTAVAGPSTINTRSTSNSSSLSGPASAVVTQTSIGQRLRDGATSVWDGTLPLLPSICAF